MAQSLVLRKLAPCFICEELSPPAVPSALSSVASFSSFKQYFGYGKNTQADGCGYPSATDYKRTISSLWGLKTEPGILRSFFISIFATTFRGEYCGSWRYYASVYPADDGSYTAISLVFREAVVTLLPNALEPSIALPRESSFAK